MSATDAPSPRNATERSMQRGALVATLVIFVLIVGVPAALYALSGQTNVALWLVGLFVAMVAVSAYALREAVKAKREEQREP